MRVTRDEQQRLQFVFETKTERFEYEEWLKQSAKGDIIGKMLVYPGYFMMGIVLGDGSFAPTLTFVPKVFKVEK